MRVMYRWLGTEITFVHVGHGLLFVGAAILLWRSVPWWFSVSLAPVFLFSLWFWLREASFVLPLARLYLSGQPFPDARSRPPASNRDTV